MVHTSDADQLDHTLHRQYSSSFGRWMSPDPGGVKVVNMDTPQTWNMYAYVADNPTTDTDPTGLSSQYNTNGGCATLRNCTDDRQSLDHPPGQELPSGTNTHQANMLTNKTQGTQVTVAAQQQKQVQHRTLVGAGIAAERKYNPRSIKQDREYAGWIGKTKNGKYVVDPAHPGTQAGSNPGPRPRNAAANYHTHGGNDPGYDNEHFSPQDKRFLQQNHVPGFLGTPGHTIQEYDPTTGKVIIFKERTE